MKCSTTGRPQIGSYRDLDSKEKGQYPSGFITERRPTCIRCLLSIPLERCWHRSSSRFIDHIWSRYCHRGEMDPRAVPLPRLGSRRSKTKCLRHCYSGTRMSSSSRPLGHFTSESCKKPFVLCEPIQHQPHRDTFYLLKNYYRTLLKRRLNMILFSQKCLQQPTWDFLNFRVVCSSTLGNIIYSYIHIFAATIILVVSCDEDTV